MGDAEMPLFEAALGSVCHPPRAGGLIADMDYVADVLYGRAKKPRARAKNSRK
jgi:hypothetical protein